MATLESNFHVQDVIPYKTASGGGYVHDRSPENEKLVCTMADRRANDDRVKKRKKKRSHGQMVKKLARRRNHGSEVDSDTYQYMVRILDLMKGDFDSVEEKFIFVNNVFEQTVDHEIEYAQNQVGSRILDSLLKYASLDAIRKLYTAFKSSLRLLSNDRFASHVLQRIVEVCADRGNRSAAPQPGPEETGDARVSVAESEVNSYNELTLKLSKYFVNNIEEFVFDTYANHLLRTVLECLGGLIDKSVSTDGKKVAFAERRPVVQDYKDLLLQTCNRLSRWPQFLEFGRDELTSGLLQSALHSLKDAYPDAAETYVKKITEECFKPGTEQQLSNIFDAECSVRLLEACLATASPKSFYKIYEKYFAGNLKRLSLMQGTNFGVQRLLDHCTVKEDFEKIFEEAIACFADVLEKGYTGVLVSAANACLRLQTKQGSFVAELSKALRCEASKEQHRIVACIVSLKTAEQWENLRAQDNAKTPISLHGSLIVQAILKFNKPIKLVNSLLETDSEDLARLFEDPKGSRIVDAFMDSAYIGEKSRERIAKKLNGFWARLASGTHGSRVLDRIWQWARANQRALIMGELAAAGESLSASKTGRIISNKLNVPLFARNPKDWTEAQGKEEKTKALFADVIGPAVSKG